MLKAYKHPDEKLLLAKEKIIIDSVGSAYDRIAELINNPDNYTEEEFIQEFNYASLAMECYRGDEELPCQDETLSWEAKKHSDGQIIILSPPIVKGKKAVRLGIPIKNFIRGNHLKVFSFPFPPGEKESWGMPCITTNKFGANLPAIFALWDFVARTGINESKKAGIISDGWVDNIFESAVCATPQEYDLIGLYKRGRATTSNQEILEIERLCQAHNITSDMIHGEGRRDRQGRYYNTWFEGNYCTACDRHYREPSVRYPNPHLSHVLSKKHRKNAADLLLKQRTAQQPLQEN